MSVTTATTEVAALTTRTTHSRRIWSAAFSATPEPKLSEDSTYWTATNAVIGAAVTKLSP